METVTSRVSQHRIDFTHCCPRFDPGPWDGKRLVWHDKPFVKQHVRAVLHVPLDMGKKVTEANALIAAAHAAPERPIMLSDEHSLWGADLFIEVVKDVPGAEMATLSGTYLTRVFEGPYKNAPTWAKEMTQDVQAQGAQIKKLYFGYTTCPACAKAYGENYVVLFAQIA